MSDPGLTEATQRVMRKLGCEKQAENGEAWCSVHESSDAPADWTGDGCPVAVVAARAAREDVADLIQQARADELENFAHNRVQNQTAGRIFEDLLEHAAQIRAWGV